MVPRAMKSNPNSSRAKRIIQEQINENLKEVFADYSQDQMPEQMVDMINLLRAQDAEKDEGGR